MSDYLPEWTFHPTLIGNVFASRFRSILFKCEIWLEEKYGKSYELHSRLLPPWYTYAEIDSKLEETGRYVPKLIDFKYSMNWPPFVHSEGGMTRAQFALDHLWDIWYGTDLFYFDPSPEGYGPGKAMFASKKTNLTALSDLLVPILLEYLLHHTKKSLYRPGPFLVTDLVTGLYKYVQKNKNFEKVPKKALSAQKVPIAQKVYCTLIINNLLLIL